MSYKTERAEFIALMMKEFSSDPSRTADVALLLLRHAKTHGRLATESCNGHPAQGSPTMPIAEINRLQDKWDARIAKDEERIEKRIKELCDSIGCRVEFGGDPRGYTVRVYFPSGKSNTWGGEEHGYGIPQ